jgi:hypothetical protein
VTGEQPPAERWGEVPAVDLPPIESLRWTRLDTLFSARNERLPLIRDWVRLLAERELREAWLEQLGRPRGAAARVEALTVEPELEPGREPPATIRFAVLGDPGEGDRSQYAVVRPFLALHRRRPRYSFAFIVSDVIYPAGESADYHEKFYGPYNGFPAPIYAVPGNHDWDDGSLTGFMTHFAAAADGRRPNDALEPVHRALSLLGWRRRIWRGATPASSAQREVAHALAARDIRARRVAGREDVALRYPPAQPGSYFRVKVGRLWLIAIDSGMTGKLDEPQAEWLLAASREPGPKILLTGKPLAWDGRLRGADIAWQVHSDTRERSVREIVEDARHGYVAAIGGDIHNYQRYTRPLEDGRTLQYLVAGGSGAFLASTELIEHESPGIRLEQLYPSRAVSRVHFERGVGERLIGSLLLPGLSTAVAVGMAALFGVTRGLDPTHHGGAWSRGVIGLLLGAAAAYLFVRIRRLKTGFRVPAGFVALFALPPLLGVALTWLGLVARGGTAEVGYFASVVLFALLSVSFGRKLAVPNGATIHEQRPYAATVLAASGWTGALLALAAAGTVTTFSSLTGHRSWLFALSIVVVLAVGLLAHPRLGRHLWRVTALTVLLVGGAAGLILGWGWHDERAEWQALQLGLFEGGAALLAGWLATALALSLYALRLRGLHDDPVDIERRVAEAERKLADGRHRGRRELVATILRAVGAVDLLGPIFESSDPPMMKSFLDVAVTDDAVTITAYRASGFEVEADRPEAIDSVRIAI